MTKRVYVDYWPFSIGVHSYIWYDTFGEPSTVNGGPQYDNVQKGEKDKGTRGKLMGKSFHDGNVNDEKLNGVKIDWEKNGWICEDYFVEDLLNAEQSYQEDMPYDPRAKEGYNSNGYIHSILNVLGINIGRNVGYGWDKVFNINYTPIWKGP